MCESFSIFKVNYNGAKICWSLNELSTTNSGDGNCKEVSSSGGRLVFNFKPKVFNLI